MSRCIVSDRVSFAPRAVGFIFVPNTCLSLYFLTIEKLSISPKGGTRRSNMARKRGLSKLLERYPDMALVLLIGVGKAEFRREACFIRALIRDVSEKAYFC